MARIQIVAASVVFDAPGQVAETLLSDELIDALRSILTGLTKPPAEKDSAASADRTSS